MRFRIDLKIFIFLIIFYFTRQIEIYSILMLFALIHELGHLLAGLLVGMQPEKLELMPFGVAISFKIKPEEYNKKRKSIRNQKNISSTCRTNYKLYSHCHYIKSKYRII